jgi:hypothetical protein
LVLQVNPLFPKILAPIFEKSSERKKIILVLSPVSLSRGVVVRHDAFFEMAIFFSPKNRQGQKFRPDFIAQILAKQSAARMRSSKSVDYELIAS